MSARMEKVACTAFLAQSFSAHFPRGRVLQQPRLISTTISFRLSLPWLVAHTHFHVAPTEMLGVLRVCHRTEKVHSEFVLSDHPAIITFGPVSFGSLKAHPAS